MSSGSLVEDSGSGGRATVASGESAAPGIAGLSALKGLVLYGAVLTFAGLYLYFVVRISAATRAPAFGTALTSAAAALAGVLGSAFALEIGVPTDSRSTNQALSQAISQARTPSDRARVRVWQVFSLERSDAASPSWPKTVGVWLYAIVASAVAVTYVLNQSQTPDAIKALALAFGGYVIALVNAAYKSSS